MKNLLYNFMPTVQGGAGLGLLQIVPGAQTGSIDISEISSVFVAVVTAIIQLVTLFKRKKKEA